MSEELSQRDLISHPFKMGDWCFYNIGSTTLEQLKRAGIISDRNYGKLSNKRPDALITLSHDRVIACVEYKQAKELSTEKRKRSPLSKNLKLPGSWARMFLLLLMDAKRRFGLTLLQEIGFSTKRGTP